MESPKPSKRPRLAGNFTPHYPSAAPSTSSPIADEQTAIKDDVVVVGRPIAEEASTLTPVSDVKPSRDEEMQEREDGDERSPQRQDQQHENGSDDVDMVEAHIESGDRRSSGSLEQGHVQTNHDWHWSEPTARPEAVAAHLNANMGNLYKLASTSSVHGYPHPSQNLISLYGLDEVVTSIRRVDPLTGEKVNKLRKSYEGKVKELRIAGRNKAIQTPNEFSNLLMVPDEDWHNSTVHGNELSRGLNTNLLKRACQILPGKLPDKEAEKWKAILATDEAPIAKPGATAKFPTAQRPGITQTNQTPNASGQNFNAPPRPARTTSKRSYQDSSFAGYGEGFGDDEDLSDDDGRKSASGARKRRKKEQDYSVSPLPPQQQPYGVSLAAGGPRH
jgi:Rox3 mediator complex subunit